MKQMVTLTKPSLETETLGMRGPLSRAKFRAFEGEELCLLAGEGASALSGGWTSRGVPSLADGGASAGAGGLTSRGVPSRAAEGVSAEREGLTSRGVPSLPPGLGLTPAARPPDFAAGVSALGTSCLAGVAIRPLSPVALHGCNIKSGES